jgi:RNA polymerase sigma-70 factor (ECF subfamily)
MTRSPRPDLVAGWLAQSRAGQPEALGHALEACRQYLLMVATSALPDDLRGKGGASDLVQEAFLDAHRHFGNFHGTTSEELLAWLGEILRCRAANFRRDFHAARRHVGREVPLDVGNGAGHPAEPAAEDDTPSAAASREEDARLLERAVARLPDDYRRVVVLRYQEHRSFEEIAALLNRSLDATRQLWKRAVRQLRKELKAP